MILLLSRCYVWLVASKEELDCDVRAPGYNIEGGVRRTCIGQSRQPHVEAGVESSTSTTGMEVDSSVWMPAWRGCWKQPRGLATFSTAWVRVEIRALF